MNSRSCGRIQTVGSGSAVVGERRAEILEAHLGTCVGVTLCDSRRGIGGLLHILLPEPTGSLMAGPPETYASTGLPLFIQALCGADARKEDLTACLAGGALVGPPSNLDLGLDIGGRTAEIVEEILQREDIPIRKSETGGFFTSRLSLDMESWESSIEPLGLFQDQVTEGRFTRPTPEGLDRAVAEVLPIPQIALKVLRMIREGRHSMGDMAREVRRDQVISAKVIRLCNSPLFSVRANIDSIDRALIMLGEKRFLQLVISASLEDVFGESAQGYSLCKGGLFTHALGTALVTEALAGMTGGVSTDVAYTAGLLHDIGKVVLDQYMAGAYPLFYRRTQVEGESLVEVEREGFGITHAEAGGRLAEGWSLPDALVEVIRDHHHPERATVNPHLTHLVYLADLLVSRFWVGYELERLNTRSLAQRMRAVGLAPDRFPALVEGMPREVFAMQTGGIPG